MLKSDLLVKVLLALAAVALLVFGAMTYRSHVWGQGYAQAEADRAARDNAAIAKRVTENAAKAVQNESINATVTKAKNEKLEPVIRTIYVDRVRVGPGVCGPTAATETKDASGSNAGDSAPRLVSQPTEEDLRALTVRVEEAFATGRACQEWGRAHGYAD